MALSAKEADIQMMSSAEVHLGTKNCDDDFMADEDRISSLPDRVLLEIISRIKIIDKRKEEERLMSTKEVIKTTAPISKRWRYLWTRLPTLVFLENDAFKKRGTCYTIGFNDLTNYSLFIDKTLTQCSTDINLKTFKLQIQNLNARQPTSQVNSWIHYAITRNVQEIDLRIRGNFRHSSCDDELFFNNSCLISMKLSDCAFNPPNDTNRLNIFAFNPPNGAIRWDKLKFLCINEGQIDEDSLGKILSGSPCLETLELSDCYIVGRIPNSLFGDFGVLEHLSCDWETYKRFSYVDELFLDHSYSISMKLSRCVFNPPNGAICMDKLTFLRIERAELDEDSIGIILTGSPCLETLELKWCCGFRRIDVTSKSLKNLVLSSYGDRKPGENYIRTLEINAPYILSLTIKGKMYLEEFLLENVSSLVKADLNYLGSRHFSEDLGRHRYDIEEELLEGLLSSLGHVNEIALGDYNCLDALSDLEAKGFQFREGSDRLGRYPHSYRVFSLNNN